MPSLPLPFVVALLLAILFVTLARRDAAEANGPFLALIATCTLASILLGLRWGYGIEQAHYAVPVLAAAVPPLVYASFGTLIFRRAEWRLATLWPHALPIVAVGLLVALWRPLIDAVLIAIYLGYAAALLWFAGASPNALGRSRFDGAVPAHRALQLSAVALIGSAMIDVIVALDFEWAHGAHASSVIAVANLLGLFAIGFAASVAGRSQPSTETIETREAPSPVETAEDREVLAKIEDLMRTQELFRDENLNLDRLARRAGVSSRRISAAINRLMAKNVSQYVNDHRIAAACELLKTTSRSVTVIMFEVGFQTKSNFNREFRRLTGMNPVAWREKNAAAV